MGGTWRTGGRAECGPTSGGSGGDWGFRGPRMLQPWRDEASPSSHQSSGSSSRDPTGKQYRPMFQMERLRLREQSNSPRVTWLGAGSGSQVGFELSSPGLFSSLPALPFPHVPLLPGQTAHGRARSIQVRLELPSESIWGALPGSQNTCTHAVPAAGTPSPPPPLPSQLRSIVCPAPSREISLFCGDPLCKLLFPHCCVRDVLELSGFPLDTCVCACMSCEC